MLPISALSILSALPVPIVVVDRSEHVVAMNPAASDLLGRDKVGRHVVTVIRQPAVLGAIADCLASGQQTEARFVAKDHVHETVYAVTCAPAPDVPGLGAVVSIQDVTWQETAGQMRRDFVANVSHELRTPLTAIQGFIETLQGPARGDVDASDRFLSTMATEAERMSRLVGDLLSLSQVESEERVRPTERVDLGEVLGTVVKNMTPLAQSAGVILHLPAAMGPQWILGDADQLVQVFTNLTENAIKYGSDGGKVEMGVEELRRDPILGTRAIQVNIRDFGQGFDERHSHRLTERFYRIDNHRSRSKGGTGLGLAIVKHIVNRHKGRLRIRSTVGEGSCFSIILPAT